MNVLGGSGVAQLKKLWGGALMHLPIRYLLRDEFTTAQGAPLTTPRTCEPGPGTLTLMQTDGQFSIANGQLVFPAQATPVWGDQALVSSSSSARVAGRSVSGRLTYSVIAGKYNWFGWSQAAVPTDAGNAGQFILRSDAGNLSVGDQGSILSLSAILATSTIYDLVLVFRNTGVFFFARGGPYADFTLVWISVHASTAAWAAFNNYSSTGTLDWMHVRDLGGAFATDNGIATLVVASPVLGTSYIGDADGIIDVTFTVPNPFNNTIQLMYRYQDDQNRWYIEAMLSGTIQLVSVVAGSMVQRATAVGVFVAGQTYTVRVIVDGTKHNMYTLSGTTWTKRGAEVNLSTPMDALTTVRLGSGVAFNQANLMSFPRRSPLYDQLSAS